VQGAACRCRPIDVKTQGVDRTGVPTEMGASATGVTMYP
jgi:hypothetical protein